MLLKGNVWCIVQSELAVRRVSARRTAFFVNTKRLNDSSFGKI